MQSTIVPRTEISKLLQIRSNLAEIKMHDGAFPAPATRGWGGGEGKGCLHSKTSLMRSAACPFCFSSKKKKNINL